MCLIVDVYAYWQQLYWALREMNRSVNYGIREMLQRSPWSFGIFIFLETLILFFNIF